MKRSVLFMLCALFLIDGWAQINSFKLPCDTSITVIYTKSAETLILKFIKFKRVPLTLPNDKIATLKQSKAQATFNEVSGLFTAAEGFLPAESDIQSVSYSADTTKATVEYKQEYTKAGIQDLNNSALRNKLFAELQAQFGQISGCEIDNFFSRLGNEITRINNIILTNSLLPKMENSSIIAQLIDSNTKKIKKVPYYNYDIRNPIAFTEFVVRGPRVNGRNRMLKPSNYASYLYIRPGSLINVTFKDEILKRLNPIKLSIKAYLKRKDETVVPVIVSGYYEVSLQSNSSQYEKSSTTASQKLQYNYDATALSLPPVQAEINTTGTNPQVGDKLIVTVSNNSDQNMTFTMTFEYEDFGWTHQPVGGFSWINQINTGSHDFIPAGTAGYNFQYKISRGGPFWLDFFSPSFGPEMNVLQDAQQNTQIALGASVSEFLRTVKFGFGWFLNANTGNPYFSIGVNFIEGFQAISSILSRSQANTSSK